MIFLNVVPPHPPPQLLVGPCGSQHNPRACPAHPQDWGVLKPFARARKGGSERVVLCKTCGVSTLL